MGEVISSAPLSLGGLSDVLLGDPTVYTQQDRVTHLLFNVRELSSGGRR